MSKLGFDKVLIKLASLEKNFFTRAMDEAQKEFRKNFDSESNLEDGTKWNPVKRNVPPPILDVSGSLKSETLDKRNITITTRKAVLLINPIDNRGRSYARFHQEGFIHLKAGKIAARKYVTQSSYLTLTQRSILQSEIDKCFK